MVNSSICFQIPPNKSYINRLLLSLLAILLAKCHTYNKVIFNNIDLLFCDYLQSTAVLILILLYLMRISRGQNIYYVFLKLSIKRVTTRH